MAFKQPDDKGRQSPPFPAVQPPSKPAAAARGKSGQNRHTAEEFSRALDVARRLPRLDDVVNGIWRPGDRATGREESRFPSPIRRKVVRQALGPVLADGGHAIGARDLDRLHGLGPDPAVFHVHGRRGDALLVRQPRGSRRFLGQAVRSCAGALLDPDPFGDISTLHAFHDDLFHVRGRVDADRARAISSSFCF